MEYDVVIVGAGPAGLAAAIRLKQLGMEQNRDIRVCLLEKGAQVGSHSISGAVFEPRSLKELLPSRWQEAPLHTPVTQDLFYYLTKRYAIRLPTPPQMKNHGNFIISLGELCQFLAKIAEELGCEIYPSFPAVEILYNEQDRVIGVVTGSFGIDKQHQPTANFQPGMKLFARYTLFAEGCRGQLSQEIIQHYQLANQAQTYGLGIKEIWQINPKLHEEGKVIHTIGWPLDSKTYGGSFIYHIKNHQLALGLVVGLDYQNTWLSPFGEMQRFKTHPFVKRLLNGAERIAYGARAITEGGWQSLPKLSFPGGALLGDAAGFLNVPKIKGNHTAIKSGLIAAEATFEAFNEEKSTELSTYGIKVKQSWLAPELYKVRNIRPGFQHGLWLGLANACIETFTQGKLPWTLKNHADYQCLKLTALCKKITYLPPDNVLTFDRLSSVQLTNTYHEENQPCHLVLIEPALAITVNYKDYASPETRYCPAAVYEIVEHENGPYLQINAQNCIHCKTCDIKDPRQNIIWKAPEGGGGPNYVGM